MTKFLDIAVKNLKTIFRDKKGTLFLILIPVMFYSLMGFVFGGQDSNEAQVYAYKVGYVDMDTSTSNHPTKNVPFLVEKINDTETVDLFMYEDNNSAFQALQQKEVDAYFIIPGGFELFINGTNSSLQENITFYFRGSTSEIAKSIIVSTVIGVIEGVVNYDPLDIRVPFEETTTAGENLNTLTLGTPGYLMYGVLSGLASAVILLTM